MAITSPITETATALEKRTWRTEFESPRGANLAGYTARWHREANKLNDKGEVVGNEPGTTVSRNAVDILADTVTVTDPATGKPATVTAALAMAVISAFGDKYAADDDAAAAEAAKAAANKS